MNDGVVDHLEFLFDLVQNHGFTHVIRLECLPLSLASHLGELGLFLPLFGVLHALSAAIKVRQLWKIVFVSETNWILRYFVYLFITAVRTLIIAQFGNSDRDAIPQLFISRREAFEFSFPDMVEEVIQNFWVVGIA